MLNPYKLLCLSFILLASSCDPFGVDSSSTPNEAPTSSFKVIKQDSPRTYYFDSSASFDPEGSDLAYDWDFGDGTSSASSTPFHTYENYGTYTISLRILDQNKASNTEVRQITIENEAPEALFDITQNFAMVELDASNSNDSDDEFNELSFSWDFGDDSDEQSGAMVSHEYSNIGQYTITLTVTDSFGVDHKAQELVLVESLDGNVAPVANFTNIVNGFVVDFDGSSSTDFENQSLTYLWDLGDGETSIDQSFSHTYSQYDTYLVTLVVTDESGASNMFSKSIAIIDDSLPTQTQTESQTNTQTDTNSNTNTDTQSEIETQTNTQSNIETNTQTDTEVISNEPPVLGGVQVFVDNNTYQFDMSSTADDYDSTEQLEFLWDFGDGQTGVGAIVAHEYLVAGTYTIRVEVSDTQGAMSVGVFDFDVVISNVTDTQTSTDIQTQTDVNTQTATETNTQTTTEINTETLTEIVTQTQTQTDTNIQTNNAPQAAFGLSANNRQVNLDASASSDIDNDALTYTWNMGDAEPSVTLNNALYEYHYAAPGNYIIELTVNDSQASNNLDSTTFNIVILNNLPVVDFSVIKNNLDLSFSNLSSDLDDDALTYLWDMGDGTTYNTLDVSHTYLTQEEFSVSLTVTDSFNGTSNTIQTIDLTPDAVNFAPNIVAQFTQNDYQILIDASQTTEPESEALTFEWDLGNTVVISDQNSIDYTYDQQGTYDIQLTVTDESSNESTWNQSVEVILPQLTYEQLSEKISIDVVAGLNCIACHSDDDLNTSALTFVSTDVIDVQNSLFNYFELDFNSDITLKEKPTETVTHLGGNVFDQLPMLRDYWFEYIDETKLIWQNINRAPVAAFEFDNIINLLVAVNASTSYDENGDTITYQWNYDGKTAIGRTPVLTFDQAGVYDVELVVSDGVLTDSITKPVTVSEAGSGNTAPTISYSISKDYLNVNFDASDTTDNDNDSLSFVWTINGEELIGEIVNYEFIQAGSYSFSLEVNDGTQSVVANGIVDVVAQPIINQPPIATIGTSANGLIVTFDASGSSDPEEGVLEYLWTVNNEMFSSESFEYTFAAAGTYQVQLVVTDNENLSDVDSMLLEVSIVNQIPTAALQLSLDGTVIVLDGSSSSDPENQILTYHYLIDGQTYTGAVAGHSISVVGTYNVELTVTDSFGASDTVTESIVVDVINESPIANFSYTTNGLIVYFDASTSTDPEEGELEYFWQFSGQNPTGVTTQYTFSVPNRYAVQLTVRDEHGAQSTIIKNVTVTEPDNYLPTASFVETTTFMDVALDASLSNDPDGSIVRYTWTIENKTRTGETLDYTFDEEGTHTILLEVEDDVGATDTYSEEVTVSIDPNANEAPVPFILSGIQAGQYILLNGGNSYDADSSDNLDYTWVLSNGDVYYGAKFYYEVPDTDLFTATLTVSDSKESTTISEDISVISGAINRPYDIEMFEMASATSCASACHSGSHPFDQRYDMTDWDSDFRDMLSQMGATDLYEFPTGQSGGHPGNNAVGTGNWEQWLNLVRLVDADVNSNNNQPPIADFDVSVVGDTVTMINNSSDPEEASLTFDWEFGDFQAATSQNPVHIYSNPGQYVIKLTVNDGYTFKQFNKLVEVSF